MRSVFRGVVLLFGASLDASIASLQYTFFVILCNVIKLLPLRVEERVFKNSDVPPADIYCYSHSMVAGGLLLMS
jgi:hypothetical protein